MKRIERTFVRKLSKAGWATYCDDEGRTVTNAYKKELQELSEIAGMELEIVSTVGNLVRVGPVLEGKP